MLAGIPVWYPKEIHAATVIYSSCAQGVERMRASGRLAADVLAYAGTLVKVRRHDARFPQAFQAYSASRGRRHSCLNGAA